MSEEKAMSFWSSLKGDTFFAKARTAATIGFYLAVCVAGVVLVGFVVYVDAVAWWRRAFGSYL